MVRRPIEKAVLRLYRRPGEMKAMLNDERCKDALGGYRDVLEQHGLVASTATFVRRLPPFVIAVGLLIGVGVYKIEIALSQGRNNIGFLFVFMLAFAYACFLIYRRHLTPQGEAMMTDLRGIFFRLKERAAFLRQGGATNEAALLAAVFGIAALSADQFPGIKALYPKRSNDGSSCGSGGCGGSCGGGCGGGCGG